MDVVEHWDGIFKSREWGKYPDTSIVRFIGRNYFPVNDRSKINILEIGPGPGANLWFLANEKFKVWGIEGSVTATEKCIKRLEEDSLSGQIGSIVAGNFNNIPFDNNKFEAIIDVEALSCNDFRTSKEIISSVVDKLKSGGKFFSLTFTDKCSREGEKISRNYYNISGGNFAGMGCIRFTKKDEIEELYLRADVQINSVEQYDRILADGSIISEWGIEVQKL